MKKEETEFNNTHREATEWRGIDHSTVSCLRARGMVVLITHEIWIARDGEESRKERSMIIPLWSSIKMRSFPFCWKVWDGAPDGHSLHSEEHHYNSQKYWSFNLLQSGWPWVMVDQPTRIIVSWLDYRSVYWSAMKNAFQNIEFLWKTVK